MIVVILQLNFIQIEHSNSNDKNYGSAARESVYDPTCGSGGLLLNCALHFKSEGKEYRTLKLYGQEINLITSAIARMNMFMHGIEEFSIIRGDTLANPAFLHNDELKKFNVILANPPYSIKAWDQKVPQTKGSSLWQQ